MIEKEVDIGFGGKKVSIEFKRGTFTNEEYLFHTFFSGGVIVDNGESVIFFPLNVISQIYFDKR